MKMRIERVYNLIGKYIAVVILPISVLVGTATAYNNHINPTIKVEAPIQALSMDEAEVITILPGSKIQRELIEPTLPNPSVDIATHTPVIEPTQAPNTVRARLSHYWPQYGPPNCIEINWDGATCSSKLWDGEVYKHWSYFAQFKTTACPGEYELGTIFEIPGFGRYKCIDRGGAIETLPDGSIFLDLLTWEMPYIKGGETVRDIYSPSGHYIVEVKVLDK